MEVKVIGQMDNTIDHTFESANRVYDVGGVSPTINTCGGGGLQPKIIDDTYANRQPRVYEDYSPALRSEREGLKTIEQDICRIENLIIGGEQKHQAIKKEVRLHLFLFKTKPPWQAVYFILCYTVFL